MAKFARRRFIQLLGGFAGALPSARAVCSPLVPKEYKRRISQRELEDGIELHARWLKAADRGVRAVFSDCDLSGRDFLSDTPDIVDLRGSDFTEADLSAVTGNQVSFHRASLQGARLSWSHLKLPIFCDATLRRAFCDNVLWGWPSQSSFEPPAEGAYCRPRATFINTDLSLTNFDDARVIGYFSGTRFGNASLRRTDLSHSSFAGRKAFCETSFSGSDLIRTNFQYASIDAITFRLARLIDVDFSFADIGYDCIWPHGQDFPPVPC
jgi:uncharacterized protein YjbI with pentapeptide repeats